MPTSPSAPELIGLVVAALGGAAIGLERQRSGRADGPAARFGGLRTFTMLGSIGGLSGWLWMTGAVLPASLLVGGAVGLIGIAYAAASRRDVDATTEVAALLVVAAGLLAGLGQVRLASGIFAIEVLLLVEKSRLHAFARRLADDDVRSGVRFGVMALVILPLLPAGPYPPFGSVRPRELWMLVLFFSGLSFLGHVLRRAFGANRGYVLSGLLGGLVSSTNVTFTFARSSRAHPPLARPLAFGAIAANAMLYPRVLAATAVLNPALVPGLAPYLAAPALVAVVIAGVGAFLRTRGEPAQPPPERNPLQLASALQMALIFQAVLILMALVRARWGQSGVLGTAAVLGLTDVDALTMSMARGAGGGNGLDLAALAIAVGVLANTALKMAVAVVLGHATFRVVAGGTLGAMIVAAAGAIAWLG